MYVWYGIKYYSDIEFFFKKIQGKASKNVLITIRRYLHSLLFRNTLFS